ncbi:MAG: hypothetical protein WAT71_17500 [Ignavibacteria bacterium]
MKKIELIIVFSVLLALAYSINKWSSGEPIFPIAFIDNFKYYDIKILSEVKFTKNENIQKDDTALKVEIDIKFRIKDKRK